MSQVLKGAYIRDSDGGTPIIKLEDGNNYWYGSPGIPPTSGFFKIHGGSWCYTATEQEYNQQEDVFIEVAPENSEETQRITELRKELLRKMALMHDHNNELKRLCRKLPEKEGQDVLLLLDGITNGISLTLKYFGLT
jgi:hypothetical protein